MNRYLLFTLLGLIGMVASVAAAGVFGFPLVVLFWVTSFASGLTFGRNLVLWRDGL